jgi:5-hydroxyisourate hydrolase
MSSISTHVLDTGSGEPAAGVRVELYREEELLASGETDADGRIAPLADSVESGDYRLVFYPPSPFFRRIALDVALDGSSHFHVPLLVAPYLCTSYRGS